MKTIVAKSVILNRKLNSSIYRFSSYITNEFDLLQRSIVPTNHFQDSLPPLPIPKLENTLKRYEASQASVLDSKSLSTVKKHIDNFLQKEGPNLHLKLLYFQKLNRLTNYVNILWTDKYLKDRQPVVLTHNPTMVFKNLQRNTGTSSQLIRATNMIFSSIRFCRSLKSNLLEPALYHMNKEKTDTQFFRNLIRHVPSFISWYAAYFLKVYALDMSQLQYLINSSRIPKLNKDEILKVEDAKHILIIHNNQMYTFDIFQDNGRGIEPKQILANLKFILNQPIDDKYIGLGVLTTMNRDKWSTVRQQLLQLGNENNIHQIDAAAFVVALDNFQYKSPNDIIINTLHGPAENRWFDKSFSLIIDAKGEAAINFEHSWGDGIAVLTYFNEVYNDSEKNPQFSKPLTSDEESQLPAPQVTRLDFHLDVQFKETILPDAKKSYDDKRKLINLDVGQSESLNKNYLETTKIDADAAMQLAFQMAYYKLNGKQAPSYESASTSGFKHGRTETLRPATLETKDFCEMIHKLETNNSDLYDALEKCSKKHNKLKFEALMGQGWDRHLMGLKHFAELSGKLPDLFTDPNYIDINQIIISTSTVPSDALEMGAFAAVTHDGYGIGYGIRDSDCGAIITTWSDSSISKGSQYMDALLESFKEIREIIDFRKSK